MNATAIKNKIRRLTNTTSTDYTDAQLVEDFNQEASQIHIGILRDRGTLEFDDSNYNDLPVATFAISAGTREYKITVDENSNEIYTKHKVAVLKDGKYQDVPRQTIGESNQDDLLTRDTDSKAIPSGYYEVGQSIVFSDMPSQSTTGKVWFDRALSFLVEGDTTKTPGFASTYHNLACLRTAMKYEHLNDQMFNKISRLIQREEENLELFEEARRGDEATTLSVETKSGL